MTPSRKDKLNKVLNKRQTDLTVVMENIHDPHNIAAVMRSCDAVGLQDIYILNTILPTRKNWGIRSSSSANKWLSIHTFDNTEECFKTVREQYQKVYTTKLTDDAEELFNMNLTESIALVFGNEKRGVTDEARQYADGNFIIPQVGMISSLNISVACAVTLYEAYRQKSLIGHYEQPKLKGEKLQQIQKEWKMHF